MEESFSVIAGDIRNRGGEDDVESGLEHENCACHTDKDTTYKILSLLDKDKDLTSDDESLSDIELELDINLPDLLKSSKARQEQQQQLQEENIERMKKRLREYATDDNLDDSDVELLEAMQVDVSLPWSGLESMDDESIWGLINGVQSEIRQLDSESVETIVKCLKDMFVKQFETIERYSEKMRNRLEARRVRRVEKKENSDNKERNRLEVERFQKLRHSIEQDFVKINQLVADLETGQKLKASELQG